MLSESTKSYIKDFIKYSDKHFSATDSHIDTILEEYRRTKRISHQTLAMYDDDITVIPSPPPGYPLR